MGVVQLLRDVGAQGIAFYRKIFDGEVRIVERLEQGEERIQSGAETYFQDADMSRREGTQARFDKDMARFLDSPVHRVIMLVEFRKIDSRTPVFCLLNDSHVRMNLARKPSASSKRLSEEC